MAAPKIDIEVFFGLADDTLKLELDLQSTTVYTLKCIACERWHIPTSCQRMVVGNTVLPDAETFAKHCQHGITGLSLVMVENYDGLFDSLLSKDKDVRWNAVGVLTQVAFKDFERSAHALYRRLQPNYECEASVRAAAIDALVQVVSLQKRSKDKAQHEKEMDKDKRKGSKSSQQSDEEKRKSSKQSTGKGADEDGAGDQAKHSEDEEEDVIRTLVDSLLGRFEDFDAGVRDAALRALLRVVTEGDPYVLSALRIYLRHDQSFVRTVALRALDKLFVDGDEDTIQAACECLGDASFEVREIAFKVLIRIVPKGHDETKVALGQHMENPSFPVRVLAIRALSLLALPGGEDIVLWLCKILGAYKEDEMQYSEPSEKGSDSGAETPSEKDGKSVTVTRVTAGDWKPEVRVVAIDALAIFSKRGHDLTNIVIKIALRDSEWQVRHAALACMVSWASQMPGALPGDAEEAQDTVEGEAPPEAPPKAASAEASPKAKSKGQGKGKAPKEPAKDPAKEAADDEARQKLLDARTRELDKVKALALTYLEDESSDMRRAAINILIRAAPSGDPEIVEAVLECLAVTDLADMKWLAMKTLVRLADPSDRRVGAALVSCIEDDDGELKASAVEAVANFITEDGEAPEEEAQPPPQSPPQSRPQSRPQTAPGVQGDVDADHEDLDGDGGAEGAGEDEEEAEDLVYVPTHAEFIDRLAATLTACLEDQRAVVRLAALLVLPKILPEGDTRAESAISERLKDRDKRVQVAARKALT